MTGQQKIVDAIDHFIQSKGYSRDQAIDVVHRYIHQSIGHQFNDFDLEVFHERHYQVQPIRAGSTSEVRSPAS